ncbi:MAG TPA: DUF1318 domain-containing protein [Candidatus Omnitrophota bacterium]|nr:DUF1318 domain-containing protein [Candidatus Omnitrophota bacterium]HPT06587.1 DUF1318 domain-containing protein [Candidatus Omnitrophota bacterium]
MKNGYICALCLLAFLGFGCARVKVEAPKDPIKVDVSMRLDIYQHVAKDIDAIENIVTGTQNKPAPADNRSCLSVFIATAYAQSLDQDVEAAALRRRDRLSNLEAYESKGVLGESKQGLVVIQSADKADTQARALVESENSDRLVIYQSVARKNGIPLADVQKMYAKKLQQNAPAGTPLETESGWQIK